MSTTFLSAPTNDVGHIRLRDEKTHMRPSSQTDAAQSCNEVARASALAFFRVFNLSLFYGGSPFSYSIWASFGRLTYEDKRACGFGD